MKRNILLFLLILSLGLLGGCWPTNTAGTLTLAVPESGYPPLQTTIVAGGVIGGQYTFEIEGKTVTQTSGTFYVTIEALPCEVTVSWLGTGDMQTATETIWLKNTGPIPGRLVLNFITNLWTLHAKERYVVTYPYAYDNEGGPIKMIDATVEWGNYGKLSVFCPPYTGLIPPKPDMYHVRLDTGVMALNAFTFFMGWGVHIEPIAGLPYAPPSYGNVPGYSAARSTCGPEWPRDTRPGADVTITTTWEDEQGAKTVDVQTIPANPYIGCGSVQTPSSVL